MYVHIANSLGDINSIEKYGLSPERVPVHAFVGSGSSLYAVVSVDGRIEKVWTEHVCICVSRSCETCPPPLNFVPLPPPTRADLDTYR